MLFGVLQHIREIHFAPVTSNDIDLPYFLFVHRCATIAIALLRPTLLHVSYCHTGTQINTLRDQESAVGTGLCQYA